MTKRKEGAADPLLESAAMITRFGDFMAHWPNSPAHMNPVAAAVVVKWFRDAFKGRLMPDEAALQSFVHWLNIAGPCDTDNIKRWTTLPPDYKKLSKAIATVMDVAPRFLEVAETRSREIAGDEFSDRMRREWHDNRVRTLRALLIGARAAADQFSLSPTAGKKKPATWKPTAQSAASFIAAAMLMAGHQSPNFNGGPALEVLQRAMHHLEGKERPLPQLREAFRRKI